MSPEQFARAVEGAYRQGGFYSAPAVEVVPLQGKEAEPEAAVLSVGGQVRRASKAE